MYHGDVRVVAAFLVEALEYARGNDPPPAQYHRPTMLTKVIVDVVVGLVSADYRVEVAGLFPIAPHLVENLEARVAYG